MVLKAIWVEKEKQWHAYLVLIPTCFFNRMHTKLRPNKLWQILKKDV